MSNMVFKYLLLFLISLSAFSQNYVNYPGSSGAGTGLPNDGNITGLILRSTGNNIGEWITPKPPPNYVVQSNAVGDAIWGINSPFRVYTVGESYVIGEYIITKPRNFIYQAMTNFTAASVATDLVANMDFVAPTDWTTSIISGGSLSYAPVLGYTVTAGTGVVVRNNNTQFPSYNTIAWPDWNFNTLPNPTGWNTVFVENTAQDVGEIKIVTGTPTPEFAKLNIMIGVIYGPTNYFQNIDVPSLDAGGTLRSLSLFIGLMKNGITFVGNSGVRTMFTSAGQLYYPGISGSTEEPNLRNCAAQPTTDFILLDQDTNFGVQTQLPNNQYDNGGTLAAITGNSWSCLKIFLSPICQISIQYCQDFWNTLNEATVGEENSRDSYVVNPELQNFNKFVGIFFFQNNYTNAADTVTGLWKNSGLMGIGIAGGGGGASAVGDVFGPFSSTSNGIARFDGPSGKVLKDSGLILNDNLVLDWPDTLGSKLVLWGNPGGATNFGLGITSGSLNYWVPSTNAHNFYTGGENASGTKEVTIANNGMIITDGLTINNNGTNSVTFPAGRGTNGQVLTTNGAGGTSWGTSSTGSIGGASNGALAVVTGNHYVIAEGMVWPSAINCSIYVRQGDNYQVVTVNGVFRTCGGAGCASFTVIANMIIGTKLMTRLRISASPGYNISFGSGVTGTVSIGRTCVRLDTGIGANTNVGAASSGTEYGAIAL